MNLQEVEFYNCPDGTVMVRKNNHPVRQLSETDRHIIEKILNTIEVLYREAFIELSEIYKRNLRNKTYYEYLIVNRFIRCNFGEYDQYHYDIDALGHFRFEEVKCPMRGECRYEGIICKPKLSTALTTREKKIFKFIAAGLQAGEISSLLCICVTTVNRHRENIKSKLGLKTIGEMVNYFNTYFKHE